QDDIRLVVNPPVGESDNFGGTITGDGDFTKEGLGSLTVGGIDLNTSGSVTVSRGSLTVSGAIHANRLDVAPNAALAAMHLDLAGSAVLEPGSTFAVTLGGTSPASQYTQLEDSDTDIGVNLDGSTLSATLGFDPVAGEPFKIVSARILKGTF